MREIFIVMGRRSSSLLKTPLKAFVSLDKAGDYIRQKKASEREKIKPTFEYSMSSTILDDEE